jgi:hypothetical protein
MEAAMRAMDEFVGGFVRFRYDDGKHWIEFQIEEPHANKLLSVQWLMAQWLWGKAKRECWRQP